MKRLFVLIGMILFPGISLCLAQEDFTLTTYYPSPHGVYDSLLADSLGVGDSDGDGLLTAADLPGNGRKLQVNGEFLAGGTLRGVEISDNTISSMRYPGAAGFGWPSLILQGANDVAGPDPSGLYIRTGAAQSIAIADTGGNVGIGTDAPAYRLDVNGDIRAIGSVYYGGTVGNPDGTAYTKPDYVFEDGYDVLTTEKVEEYLSKRRHLPWMTPLRDEKDGIINMTRMAFETVETVENLQLQIINLNKLIKEQQQTIYFLEKTIVEIKESL